MVSSFGFLWPPLYFSVSNKVLSKRDSIGTPKQPRLLPRVSMAVHKLTVKPYW